MLLLNTESMIFQRPINAVNVSLNIISFAVLFRICVDNDLLLMNWRDNESTWDSIGHEKS